MRRALCICESDPIETTGDDDDDDAAAVCNDTDADGDAGVPVCSTVLDAGANDDDDGGNGEDGAAPPSSLTFSLNSESSWMMMYTKNKQQMISIVE